MKIATILLITFILTGLILASAGTYLSNSEDIRFVESEMQSHLLTTAQSRASHIETYLEQNIERLVLITTKTQLRIELEKYNSDKNQESLDRMTKIINDAKVPIEDFDRICVIGLDGKVITSTNPVFIGKDVSNEEFFINGKEENVVHFIEEDGEIKLFVTGPFIQDGKVIGVGITVVKIDKLGEIVGDRAGLGETGEVLFAIERDGERIYLFERLFESEAVSQDVESELTAEPMKQALLGNEMFFDESLDYRNEPVIAVSQFIQLDSIDGDILGLVVKVDREETFGAVEARFLRTSLILVISIVILTSLVGFFAARFISKPIKKLNENVKSITQGNLDVQLSSSRITEVNDLTESLNRVLASMKLAILRTGATKGQLGLGEAIKEKEVAENKYKMIMENSPDGIALLDLKGNIFETNEAGAQLLGYTLEEAKRLNLSQLHPKEDLPKAKKLVGLLLKEGKAQYEINLLSKDKKIIPVILSSSLLTIGSNKYILTVVKDVSKEERLKEKFENLFRFSNFMVCTADLKKGYFTKVSPAFTKSLGWSEKEMLSKPITDFIHPDDVKKTNEALKMQMDEGKEILSFENRYKTKKGDYRLLKWTANPIIKEGVSYSVAYDITDIKKNERTLRKVLDNMYDIIYEYDSKGKLTFVGGNLQKYGYTKDDLQGQNIADFVCEEDKERVMRDVQNTLKTGQEFPTRFRLLTKESKCVPVEEIGKVKKDAKGNVISVVGTLRDLSNDSNVADITNAILVCLNRAGNVQVINQMGAEILGYKDESEIVGKNWFDNFVPEKSRENVKALANKMIAGKVVVNKYNENPVLTKSGKELNIAWHGEVIKNTNGDIIGHLAVGKVIEDKVVDKAKEKKENDDKAKAKDNVVKRLVNGAKEGLAPKKPVNKFFKAKASEPVEHRSVYTQRAQDPKLQNEGAKKVELPPKPKKPKFISKPVPVKKKVKQGAAFTKKEVEQKKEENPENKNEKPKEESGEKKYFLKK